MSVTASQITLGPFRLDPDAARLLRDGAEMELRPQAFYALCALVQHSGRYLSYEEMIRDAWHGTSVSKHTVAVTVGEVKKVLQEHGSWISHRPKLGYRLEMPKSEDLIKRGWHFQSRNTREGFEKALDCFEQAALENNTDSRAFEGISLCCLLLGTYGMRPPREMYRGFLEAHRQAVALSSLTPELRVYRAWGLHLFERKVAEAESELLQVVQEKPVLAGAHVRLTMLYAAQGRLDEALDVLVQYRAIDSLSPMCPAAEVFVRLCRKENDLAITCGKEALDLFPYMPLSRVLYAQALEAAGLPDEALAEYRLARVMCPDIPWLRALEGVCLARRGHRCEAAAILSELEQTRRSEYVDSYFVCLLLDALGNRNEAFQELERAYEENSATLFLLDADPRMDALRDDQRFVRLRNRLFGAVHSPAAA
jgi:DNA-binding winged helix-turn-helix (wHTH) protein